MKYFIVELERGIFLADRKGGRTTLKLDSAKKFKNHKAAKKSISEFRKFRPFETAEIIEVSK
ncbi:hypothetical protein [Tenacibaculum maritimum]|uniref:hypothetical protein n=1 Tax=Tenacibaculum maritimum TaxID=107401 RepID=UPI00387676A2